MRFSTWKLPGFFEKSIVNIGNVLVCSYRFSNEVGTKRLSDYNNHTGIETEMNQHRKLYDTDTNLFHVKSKVFHQSILLFALIGLAFSRWMPGGNPLNPESGTRPWVEISILLFVFLLSFFFWGPRSVFWGLKSPSFFILLVFGLWAFFTSFWSPNPILSIGKAAELIIVSIIIASIAYQSSQAGTSFIKSILVAMLLLIAFLFFINLIHYKTLFPILPFGDRYRFVLGLNHPNATTLYFSTIVLLSTHQFFNEKKLLLKLNYLFLILADLFLIELTDSRTTILSVTIGILLMIYFQFRAKRLMYLIIIGGLIALVLTAILLGSGMIDRPIHDYLINHPDFFTLNGRTDLWKTAFLNTSNLNLGGLGYYNSRFLFLNELGEGWGFSLHNSYLEVFFTTGFLGATLAVLFYFSTIPQMKLLHKFALPLVFLFYMSLEGLMGNRLFIPTIPFTITLGLIYYQQFTIQKKKSMHLHFAVEDLRNNQAKLVRKQPVNNP